MERCRRSAQSQRSAVSGGDHRRRDEHLARRSHRHSCSGQPRDGRSLQLRPAPFHRRRRGRRPRRTPGPHRSRSHRRRSALLTGHLVPLRRRCPGAARCDGPAARHRRRYGRRHRRRTARGRCGHRHPAQPDSGAGRPADRHRGLRFRPASGRRTAARTGRPAPGRLAAGHGLAVLADRGEREQPEQRHHRGRGHAQLAGRSRYPGQPDPGREPSRFDRAECAVQRRHPARHGRDQRGRRDLPEPYPPGGRGSVRRRHSGGGRDDIAEPAGIPAPPPSKQAQYSIYLDATRTFQLSTSR